MPFAVYAAYHSVGFSVTHDAFLLRIKRQRAAQARRDIA
jgi:hypothetical protein